jgi:hypothetical protein
MPGQFDELASLLHHGAALRSDAAHGDAATAAEFDKTFIPESAQPAEHGIRIHAEHGRQIPGWRQPLTGDRLTFGDRSPDRRSHLLMQWDRARVVDRDGALSATHTGIISTTVLLRNSPARPTRPAVWESSPVIRHGQRALLRRAGVMARSA